MVSPGERIEIELLAHGQLPALKDAATAVGFPITPEVIGIHITPAARTESVSRSVPLPKT
jgi:hypothetical protein